MLPLLLAIALAADPLEVVRSGTARERVVHDDADLVIFYASEHHGELGTCGCDANPRGGLPRLDGYLRAVDRHGPGTPSMLLHAGWWASDRIGDTVALRPDAVVQNTAWLQAADELGFDALNLSFRDSPWLREHPLPEAAVSANAGEGIAPVRRVSVGDLDVAITGVSRSGSKYVQPDGVTWTDPVQAVQSLLPDLADADLVVVLAYDTGKRTEELARLDGVDVLIEAGGINGKLEPWDEGALWVQSRDRGQAVGELRLWLEDGQIADFRDRWVDLDPMIPEAAPWRRLERRTAKDRARALKDAGLAE